MSELRINGFKRVRNILTELEPYIKFKEKQTKALLEACQILSETSYARLSDKQLKKISELVIRIQNENYGSSRKKGKKEIGKLLGLTP